MKIQIYNLQKKLKINKKYFISIAHNFFKTKFGKKANLPLELYISFVSIQKITKLNKLLFKKNKATDVIAVPITTNLKFQAPRNNNQIITNNQSPNSKQIKKIVNHFSSTKTLKDYNTTTLVNTQILGEIFICPAVAYSNAKTYNNTLKNELTLLVIHGLLHLVGFKDKTKKQKELMRRQEKYWIKILSTKI